MPYGGTTPEEDDKIERCVWDVMHDPKMIEKYPNNKRRKEVAIAICKSNIMSK